MPTKNITVKWLRSSKCRATSDRRQTDFWDTNPPAGFGVRVSPLTGSKTFVVRYRAHGRRRCYRIGAYPDMKLAEARIEAEEVLRKVRLGEDPAQEREHKRIEVAETFGELADKFLEIEPGKKGPRKWRRSTRIERRRIIENELRPRWGDMRLDEITKAHIRDLLEEKAVKDDAPIMANRIRGLVHVMFEWAVEREDMDVNPCSAVKRPVRDEPKRDRVMKDAEIKRLWATLDKERPVIAGLFRFMLLTATRIGETLAARWDEIDDAANAWTISGTNTKNGRTHRVALSPQAVAVLDALRDVTGEGEYVFGSPSDRSDGHAHQLWAGQRFRGACGRAKIENLTPHDLRRTATSGMGDLGVDRTVLSKLLNQGPSGGNDPVVTAIYDRAERWPQQVEAWTAWGAEVERIVSGKPHEAKVAGRIG
ncbi:MAG: tyrosine-type recombinase/integrase [Gemmatimonadota bacterium]